MAVRRSRLSERNSALREQSAAVATQRVAQENWLEKTLKPKRITARYSFKGTALLYATCAFGSLGDALFGYNSGTFFEPLIFAFLQNQRFKTTHNANTYRYYVRIIGESCLC